MPVDEELEGRSVAGKIFSSRDFTFKKDKNAFISKISETPEVLRYLWHDSLDLGFGIRSVRTGNVVFFTLKSATRDDDGRYLYWVFDVYNPENNPRFEGLVAYVFNV